ncbi:MAG: response regulator, partial [Oscillospiraceae bacterium]
MARAVVSSRKEVVCMYKVVIIDDETIIVEGLKNVMDWAAHGCAVVACGHDAASGALAIRQQEPDIVFTDIQMPDADGLTMLAGLKGEFPAMQIAVLTGYRDFEYARRAIDLGVSRFLLKPSKMSELEEALTYMTAQLGQKPGSEHRETEEVADRANSFLARQAKAYIGEHCAEKLSLQDVADHCYVSQWHLSKMLNRHLEENFYDILNHARIKRAKELLRDP